MQIRIGKTSLNVKLAINQTSIERGMMGKRFNDEFQGLLFIFPKAGTQRFWMKNCIIPLDILMISNQTIAKIHHNCPPCVDDECTTYSGIGNRVLEVPGGFCLENNISEGDLIYQED